MCCEDEFHTRPKTKTVQLVVVWCFCCRRTYSVGVDLGDELKALEVVESTSANNGNLDSLLVHETECNAKEQEKMRLALLSFLFSLLFLGSSPYLKRQKNVQEVHTCRMNGHCMNAMLKQAGSKKEKERTVGRSEYFLFVSSSVTVE